MNLKKIDSKNNETIKWIKKLQIKSKFRKTEGFYIVEGYKQIRELKEDRIHTLVVSDQKDVQEFKMMENVEIILVDRKLFGEITTDTTPQGILAVVHMKQLDFYKEEIEKEGIYLALDEIQDPGNIGTMIRLCDAVGAKGVILNKTCVDVYNPKVVKSTMGSLEHINVYVIEDLVDGLKHLNELGIVTYGSGLEGSQFHYDYKYPKGVCFVIGNEGKGISESVLQAVEYQVKIPMPGKAESLNASVAASVLVYEALRQFSI
jgi:TrmH family RNA methyltransferase